MYSEIEPRLRAIVEAPPPESADPVRQAWHDWLAWWQHPRAFFERYDLLLTPTVACPPFQVGLDYPETVAGKAVSAVRMAPVRIRST